MASGLESVIEILDREYAKNPELIDGADPRDCIDAVDLFIAYTPIVLERHGDYHAEIPKPDRVIKDGKRYAVTWPEHRDFRWLDEREHKLARARFLLLHGWYWRTFGTFPYSQQQRIVAWYFDGAMWRPNVDSPLGKAFKLI